MNCRQIQQQLVAYDDGELTDAEGESIAEHLDGCPQCRQELLRLQEVARHLAAAPPVDPGVTFRTRVMAAIARRKPVHSRMNTGLFRPIAISVALGSLLVASALLFGLLSIDFVAWQTSLAELQPMLDAMAGASPALLVTLEKSAWPVVVQFSGTVVMALVLDFALILALVALARKWREGKLAGRAGALLA